MQIPPTFDPLNWKAPAHNRWAFTHAPLFLPTARVQRGTSVSPLPVRLLDTFAPPLDVAGERLDWNAYLTRTDATSVLVLYRGILVVEHYPPGGSDEESHFLFSITKSVVGLLALMLMADGTLNDRCMVQDYVPALRGTAFGNARIAALLDMRDGVSFDETYADPTADIHAYSRHYWANAQGNTAGGTWAALKGMPARPASPGRFAYRTPVADVIGWVLSHATGQTLPDLVSERLWRPMGAASDARMTCDTAGAAMCGTGLIATPRDLARLARLLMDGGLVEERQVVPKAVIDRLIEGGDPAALVQAGHTDRPGWSYTGMWWNMGRGRLAALGVHGQRIMIDPVRKVAMIRTGATPMPDNRPYDLMHAAAFDAVCRTLDDGG